MRQGATPGQTINIRYFKGLKLIPLHWPLNGKIFRKIAEQSRILPLYEIEFNPFQFVDIVKQLTVTIRLAQIESEPIKQKVLLPRITGR